jgi:hypothetical protein
MEVGDAGSDMEATDDYHIDQSDQTTLAKTILTLGGIALTILTRRHLTNQLSKGGREGRETGTGGHVLWRRRRVPAAGVAARLAVRAARRPRLHRRRHHLDHRVPYCGHHKFQEVISSFLAYAIIWIDLTAPPPN